METAEDRGPGGGDLKAGWLPEPNLEGPLAEALRARRTVREFSDKALPPQVLSDLLWTACGINRAAGPFGVAGRTAASASNSQEVQVYAAMREGTYRYEPASHRLAPVAEGNLRRFALGARQGSGGANAPLRLIYIADTGRLEHTAGFDEPGLHDPEIQKSYYYVDCGLIAANVYLFAAARGLCAWFHNCDRAALTERLGLSDKERPLFGQTVGYPKGT